MRKFRTDISQKETSIGCQLAKHRDDLFAMSNVPALACLVKKIFEANSFHSPKANQILFKLEHGHMSMTNALIYMQNIMFASAGMATY